MEDELIWMEHGDEVAVRIEPDTGEPAIRIHNTVWGNTPDRWLRIDNIERGRKIDALIAALEDLRKMDA